jgi:hypothetical protein
MVCTHHASPFWQGTTRPEESSVQLAADSLCHPTGQTVDEETAFTHLQVPARYLVIDDRTRGALRAGAGLMRAA